MDFWFNYQKASHVAMVKASKRNKGKTVKKVHVYHCTDCDDLWRKDDEMVPYVHDVFCLPGFKPHLQMWTVTIPPPRFIEVEVEKPD